MTIRKRLASLLRRGDGPAKHADEDDAGEDDDSIYLDDWLGSVDLEQVDVDDVLPDDAPEHCPNCGEPIDDVVPPTTVSSVKIGEHTRTCHIGTREDGPLAGWQVVHR